MSKWEKEMNKTKIETHDAPCAIGPYSQALIVDGWMFCSGQIPLDPKTGQLVNGSIEDQTHQVMKNILSILKSAQIDFEQVVKVTIFLKNLSNFKNVNAVYAGYFKEPYPARSTVQVADLPMGSEVEIEVMAKV